MTMYRIVMYVIPSYPSPQSPSPQLPCASAFSAAASIQCTTATWRLPARARPQAALDEVWFMPTAIQPLKHHGPHATDAQRVEMLRSQRNAETDAGASARSKSTAAASATRSTRCGKSTKSCPKRSCFSDRRRRSPRCAALERTGGNLPPGNAARGSPRRRAGTRPHGPRARSARRKSAATRRNAAVDVSSTEIRRRVAAGESIDDLVPPAVAEFILTHKLYR